MEKKSMGYSYSYGKKDSFGQKAKRFFRKTFLTLAFGSAVGVPGYHYYGTQEEIEAKITSVEAIPSGNKDQPPKMIVHTDKGTFVNQTTWMYFKGKEDVKELTQTLQTGATVKLTVYGFNPEIGNVTPDDFRIYRNIINAVPVGNNQPPAPVAETPVKPAEAATSSASEENTMAAEVTVFNANLEEVAKKTPQLYRDLLLMEKLPLTGKGVYDLLKDPANGIQSVLFSVPKGEAADGHYKDKTARIVSGAGAAMAFHEYFHAAQDVNDGNLNASVLGMKDAAISNMLLEAAAVAYELAARYEAEKHNLKFVGPEAVVKDVSGVTTVGSTVSAADNSETIGAFQAAYDAAWKANAHLDAQTCEAKALEAGGKAVVRHLLDGKNEQWKTKYVEVATLNINNNLSLFSNDGRELKPEYKNTRDDFYAKQGVVSLQINFIPEEYLGAEADAAIDKCFKGMGFKLPEAPSPAPTKVAQNSKLPAPG